MRRATVTILLSNYNHGRYLPESLGAICGQTRPADEILVCDDGSTDDSPAIIADFARRCPAVRCFRNEQNLGLLPSVARLLPLVTSEYLVWAASDDRLLPRFIERSMAALERHPDAGLCFSELSVLKGDSGQVERFATMPGIEHTFGLSDLPEFLTPGDVVRRMQRAYLPITGNSVVVRRDALLAIGGYPGELEWYADFLAYIVIALRHGACVIPETLALIRATPGSYSHRGMNDSARHLQVLAALLDVLARAEFRDIRRAFRRAPSNFSPGRTVMLRAQFRRARDWDLLVAYLLWKIREYRRGNRLSWPQAGRRLAGRLLHRVHDHLPGWLPKTRGQLRRERDAARAELRQLRQDHLSLKAIAEEYKTLLRKTRLPPMLITTMPKSGTYYMSKLFSEGLFIETRIVSNQYFPYDVIRQQELRVLSRGSCISQDHFGANKINLTHIARHVDRMVVHLRDPRQATLSYVHYLDTPWFRGNEEETLRFVYPPLPDDYYYLPFHAKLDWAIEHWLPLLLEWTQEWVQAAGTLDRPAIKFTRFEDLVADQNAFVRDVLAFFNIPPERFLFPRIETDAEVHFRTGETEEWLRVFSPQQRAAADARIPTALAARFGWPLFGPGPGMPE